MRLIGTRTNVSPIYLILFVSATYYLNRPCLYCSLLLTVLVFTLYDWRSDWFEPRNNLYAPNLDSASGSHSIQDAAIQSASAIASAFNSTALSAAQSALHGLKRRMSGEEQAYVSGAQWLRELIGKKEWRIPCIDVLVRL